MCAIPGACSTQAHAGRSVLPLARSWLAVNIIYSDRYQRSTSGRTCSTWASTRWSATAWWPGASPAPPPLAAAANLGGGFHHAFPSHGEGFCLYNDVAVAIRVLQRDGVITRAAIVDADVHQGNGTAFIFDGDASVFTFSIHQEHNYPHPKPRGSLDVGLPDGADDHEYLRALELALPAVLASRPDVLFYVAGADPFFEDQLGGLNLTFEGLRGRDDLVFSAARGARIPVVIVLAGGYARRVEDTAAIHIATIEEALRLGA